MEFITPRMHKYMYIVEKLQSYQFECQSYTENLQTIDNVLYSFSGKTLLKLQYLDPPAIGTKFPTTSGAACWPCY